MRTEMEKGVSIGKLTRESKDRALSLLCAEKNLEKAVREADMVIEAVPEDLKLKIDTFSCVDRIAPPTAILASNTSSLSITEMAATMAHPARFCGTHFFNPGPFPPGAGGHPHTVALSL
jgi:3-hydroxyacyl-CoA dehydrogenase